MLEGNFSLKLFSRINVFFQWRYILKSYLIIKFKNWLYNQFFQLDKRSLESRGNISKFQINTVKTCIKFARNWKSEFIVRKSINPPY